MNITTIVAQNYLAQARVLARSFRHHHPDGNVYVLVLDAPDDFDAADEPFDLIRPHDFLSEEEFGVARSIYSIMELATAVKPRLLTYLLERHDHAFYFDPDIRVMQRLDDLPGLAREHGIVLTPHLAQPLSRDGRTPSETYILLSGVYNLGFIGVSRSAKSFLDWWWERLARDCIVAPDRALFVDQRWVDFAPGMFDHVIVRDQTLNVAYWNLANRKVTRDADTYLVNGSPIRFFHYSGYDPHKPHLLSKHQGAYPRILLSEHPDLRALCDEYRDALFAEGYEETSAIPYGLATLPNGVAFDDRMRQAYRAALLEFEDPLDPRGERPPNPITETDGFLDWLRQPQPGHPVPWMSRYLHAVISGRPDVIRVYRQVPGPDEAGLLDWIQKSGRTEEGIPEELMPDREVVAAPAPMVREPVGVGVNVVGYLAAELGVGEAARSVVAASQSAGETVSTLTIDANLSRQAHPFEEMRPVPDCANPFDVNIVCVNADQTVETMRRLGPDFRSNRTTVGYWAWELDEFPDVWDAAFNHVDEIWMNSAFAATGVRERTKKPVRVLPIPVVPPARAALERSDLGIPDGFMFLFSFDFLSVFERKNPIAVVRAYREAFEPEDGAVLVIKSINGHRKLADLEALRDAASGRPDIVVYDGYVDAATKDALMGACDAYVSLHRSEGFGITMAEAMALGKPVIATGYSGNLEFMTEENSLLVEYQLTEVPVGCAPYRAGAQWAEPSTEHAAHLMRTVFHDSNLRERLGGRAARDIAENHGPEARARLLSSLLDEVRRVRRSAPVVPGSHPAASLASVAAARQRASAAVQARLTNQYDQEKRFSIGRAIRRLLGRLVRPLALRAQRRDAELLAYVQSVEAIVAGHTSSLQEVKDEVASIGATATAASARASGNRDQLARALSELSTVDARVAALEWVPTAHAELVSRLESVAADVRTVSQTQGGLEKYLSQYSGDMQASVRGLEGELSTLRDHQLADRTRQDELERKLDRTYAELTARPYLSEPEEFWHLDQPEPILSFTADRQTSTGYRGFEEVFRGTEQFIRTRQSVYLALVKDYAPIVDVGSGRGEFLDLLRESGLDAVGVDLDTTMVDWARSKGHTVHHADANRYLESLEDGSVGCIFSAQFVEHITADALTAHLELAAVKLRPGGLFIAETVNPHSIQAFKTFWTDLTHRAPIFPEVLLAMGRAAGFTKGHVMFPNGSGSTMDDLTTQGEYAVILERPNE